MEAHRYNMPTSKLTDREREVVELVICGLSNQDIGKALGITRQSVKLKLEIIRDKLGVVRAGGNHQTRHQMVIKYVEMTGGDYHEILQRVRQGVIHCSPSRNSQGTEPHPNPYSSAHAQDHGADHDHSPLLSQRKRRDPDC